MAKKSQFTEEQIFWALQEVDAGAKPADVATLDGRAHRLHVSVAGRLGRQLFTVAAPVSSLNGDSKRVIVSSLHHRNDEIHANT